MATLQLRNIDDRLYNFLKNSARRQNRPVSQEVVTIIQQHLHSSPPANATLEFLALSGAWKDERDAEEIIADIRSSRKRRSSLSARRRKSPGFRGCSLAEHEIPVSNLTADEVMNDIGKLRQERMSHD
jgi:plasmid stability protein